MGSRPHVVLARALAVSLVGLAVLVGAQAPTHARTGGYPDTEATACGSYSQWCVDDVLTSSRGYWYRNCTDYVAWKLQTLGVSDEKTRGLGHAGQWASRAAEEPMAGRTVLRSPKLYAAAVKPISRGSRFGHVAFVEAIHRDGTITVSEYNRVPAGSSDPDGAYHLTRGTPASMGFTRYVDFGLTKTTASASGRMTATGPDGTVHMAALTKHGTLNTRTMPAGGSWGAFVRQGEVASWRQVDLAVGPDDRVWIAAVSTSGMLYTRYGDPTDAGTDWSSFTRHGKAGRWVSADIGVARDGQVSLAGVTRSGSLHTRYAVVGEAWTRLTSEAPAGT